MHSHSDLDAVGATLSLACAVHCLAAPVLASLAPFLFGEGAELVLGVVLFGIASIAMIRGVRRHKDLRVLVPFVVGIVLFFLPHEDEGSARDIALAVASSVALVSAHVMNYRATSAVAACC